MLFLNITTSECTIECKFIQDLREFRRSYTDVNEEDRLRRQCGFVSMSCRQQKEIKIGKKKKWIGNKIAKEHRRIRAQ